MMGRVSPRTVKKHRSFNLIFILFATLGALAAFAPGCDDASRSPRVEAPVEPIADAKARYNQPSEPDNVLSLKIIPAAEPAPRPDKPLPADASCVTSECHADLVSAPYVHGPVSVGSCDACHDRDAGGHTYPLKRKAEATCLFCHPVAGNKPFQHQPVTDPGCTVCHDPHRSNTKYLLVRSSVKQLCTECNPLRTDRYQHAPFSLGQCTLCHDPHEGSNVALLRGGDGPAHCYLCHEDKHETIANATHVHKPAEEGCVHCHDPHSAPYAYQLRQPLAEGCLACHEPVRKHLAMVSYPHGATADEQACANCHDAHASNHNHLLRNREDHLCLECHDRAILAPSGRWIANVAPELSRPYPHGPVADGECAACHDPHGENHTDLLKGAFPDTFYAPFNPGRYELCFRCHTEDMVLTERTTTITRFRQGDLNLHYVHVNRSEKGRTCRTCHDVHAGNGPHHVAATVPFEGSAWAMPIGFEITEHGGRCAPGCHKPATYDRTAASTEVAKTEGSP